MINASMKSRPYSAIIRKPGGNSSKPERGNGEPDEPFRPRDLDAWKDSPSPTQKRPRNASNASNQILHALKILKRVSRVNPSIVGCARRRGYIYDLLGAELAEQMIAEAHREAARAHGAQLPTCGKEGKGLIPGVQGAGAPCRSSPRSGALLVSPNNCFDLSGGGHGQD